MPYRRLPNTDNARIRALKKAIEKCKTLEGQEIVGVDNLRLKATLRNFETAQNHYQTSLEVQVEANKKMQDKIKNARLYISHFIQVLNFCIIRGEIKEEVKLLYGLQPHDLTIPDMNSNDTLQEWGEKIIKGEQDRMNVGATAIYNPSIARVKVAFSQFKDAYVAQRMHQSNTARQLELLSGQRGNVDELLFDIWNMVEGHFDHFPRPDKLQHCRDFGLVYYVRKRKNVEQA